MEQGSAISAKRHPCLAMPGGKPCRSKASPGMPFCHNHLGPLQRERPPNAREFLKQWRHDVEQAVSRRVSRRPMKGNYDEDLVKALLPLAIPIYAWYWRVDVY